MRKIRLDMERLEVDSFETQEAVEGVGTVHGQWSQPGTCDGRYVATCQDGGTCGNTCYTRVKCTGIYCL